MIFKQLFESESSTYTYLIGCEETRQAALIDPVVETHERDLGVLKDLDLNLAATIDTHIHADHLTAAQKLKSLTGSFIYMPSKADVSCADIHVREDQMVPVGRLSLKPLFTPGHTDHHLSFLFEAPGWQVVMTGDCLLIDGCGRTDFQGGNTHELYKSVHEKLFTLADETLVYPGHDYHGRRVSSIGQEKTRNPRLGVDQDLAAFSKIMDNLELAYPKKMELAVPANMECGQCPSSISQEMRKLCKMEAQG